MYVIYIPLLVLVHSNVLGAGQDSGDSLTLPHFLNKLQQKNVLPNEDSCNELVNEVVKGYKNARNNPGVSALIHIILQIMNEC